MIIAYCQAPDGRQYSAGVAASNGQQSIGRGKSLAAKITPATRTKSDDFANARGLTDASRHAAAGRSASRKAVNVHVATSCVRRLTSGCLSPNTAIEAVSISYGTKVNATKNYGKIVANAILRRTLYRRNADTGPGRPPVSACQPAVHRRMAPVGSPTGCYRPRRQCQNFNMATWSSRRNKERFSGSVKPFRGRSRRGNIMDAGRKTEKTLNCGERKPVGSPRPPPPSTKVRRMAGCMNTGRKPGGDHQTCCQS